MKISNKEGRKPRILSEEEIKTVEELGATCSIEQIAYHLGISERSFYNIKNRQPAVNASYKKGRAKAIHKVASKLFELIEQGNLTAIIFYLKTRAGWSEKYRDLDDEDNEAPQPTPVLVRFVTAKDLEVKPNV